MLWALINAGVHWGAGVSIVAFWGNSWPEAGVKDLGCVSMCRTFNVVSGFIK